MGIQRRETIVNVRAWCQFVLERYYRLNDAGLETVARYYAYRILNRDFSDKDWSRLKPSVRWFQGS
jgi:hypothetical protein